MVINSQYGKLCRNFVGQLNSPSTSYVVSNPGVQTNVLFDSISIHTRQLSRNIRDSPVLTALVPCPARKRLFTLKVPENLATHYPDLLTCWYRS